MKKRLAFFGVISAIIAFSVSCDGNDPGNDFGTIDGKVADRVTGAAISGANVTLSPGGTNKQTDINGFYEFKNLEPGDYSISVQRFGYRTDNSNVRVVPGESVSVNFSLAEGGN